MNEKWNHKLKTNVEDNDFVKIVRCIPEILQEVHLQSFQYHFLMHAFFSNDKPFYGKLLINHGAISVLLTLRPLNIYSLRVLKLIIFGNRYKIGMKP